MSDDGQITQLLRAWTGGRPEALDELMPLVIDDLRRMASGCLRGERQGHLLQSTALVNEVFLNLLGRNRLQWRNRAQFFGFFAQQMRHTLVDYARRRETFKRGRHFNFSSLDTAVAVADKQDLDLVALHDALSELERIEPEACRVVELRFLFGLSYDEIAEILEVSKMTVRRRWAGARAWLYQYLAADEELT